MNETNNIDELLKQSFEGFTPEPPANIWQGISNQLPVSEVAVNADASETVVNTVAKVKTFTVATKAIVTAAVIATTGAAAWLVQTNQNNNTPPVEPTSVNKTIEKPAEETLTLMQPVDETATLVKPTKPETKKDLSLEGLVVAKSSNTNSQQATNSFYKSSEFIEPTSQKTEFEQKPVNQINPESNFTIKKLADNEAKSEEEMPESTTENGQDEPEPAAEVVFANVITPNNDGLNDLFDFIKFKNAEYVHLTIINRRHETVFESSDLQNKWDGKHFKTGIDCPEGIYQFVFQYKTLGQPDVKTKLGTVKILR